MSQFPKSTSSPTAPFEGFPTALTYEDGLREGRQEGFAHATAAFVPHAHQLSTFAMAIHQSIADLNTKRGDEREHSLKCFFHQLPDSITSVLEGYLAASASLNKAEADASKGLAPATKTDSYADGMRDGSAYEKTRSGLRTITTLRAIARFHTTLNQRTKAIQKAEPHEAMKLITAFFTAFPKEMKTLVSSVTDPLSSPETAE